LVGLLEFGDAVPDPDDSGSLGGDAGSASAAAASRRIRSPNFPPPPPDDVAATVAVDPSAVEAAEFMLAL
jgi:hypothetical protein